MLTEGKTFFNVDSRLLIQLGEKLLTNRTVALAELVKNSYDADATHVTIRMSDVRTLGGTITVEDNGTGMSLPTFERTWMRIATIDKEEHPVSEKYSRKKSGEKGIGRFACRKLSDKLLLRSVAETESGVKEELRAVFEWNEFTPGSDVDKAPIRYSTQIVDNDISTGTTLTLDNTTEIWEISDVRRLRTELMDLISPAMIAPETEYMTTPEQFDPGFKVELDCAEFPEAAISLDESFFSSAWAKLTGSVDCNGVATYDIKAIKKIKTEVERTFEMKKPFSHLKNAQLKVYIFSYRADLFYNSEWGLNRTRQLGDERGGIKVYADKFRVFGYGRSGDDWLGVDYDRGRSIVNVRSREVMPLALEDTRPGLHTFRNNNLFGHVMFARQDNRGLGITVNRESLIEGETFEELRRFARLGIDFVTVLYSNEIERERQEKREKARVREEARRKAWEEARKRAEEAQRKADEQRSAAEERQRTIELQVQQAEAERVAAEEKRREVENQRREAEEQLRKTGDEELQRRVKQLLGIERQHLIIEEQARQREQAARGLALDTIIAVGREKENADAEVRRAEAERRRFDEEEIQQRLEEIAQEFRLLRVLASTGTLILIFEHELQALVEDMEEMVTSFSEVLTKTPDSEQKIYHQVLESFSNRTNMIKELGAFLGLTIGADSRQEKKAWVLSPIIDSVIRPFSLYFKESGINFHNALPENLRTPRMYRSELVSVLHNLMSNAFKAVKGQQERRIEVTGFEAEGFVHVRFLDSGKGLHRSRWEDSFRPFETDSEPDLVFGSGTGLGLNIARDIVRSYGGDAAFVEPPQQWKTCIEITFPVED